MAGIVFDLDGTLVDSAPHIMGVANVVLRAEGVPPVDLTETRGFIGRGARVFVQRMSVARGLADHDLDRLHSAFLAAFDAQPESATFYPGVPDALQALRAQGHRLGLCTNKPSRPAASLLAHLGVSDLFDAVIGGDSLPVLKPDPAPLRAAFAALGPPLLYVGDSEVDRDTALAADMPFALFTGGYRQGGLDAFRAARITFDDWAALPVLVAGL